MLIQLITYRFFSSTLPFNSAATSTSRTSITSREPILGRDYLASGEEARQRPEDGTSARWTKRLRELL